MENSKYGEIGSFPSLVSSHLFGRFAFFVAKEAPALVNIAGLMGSVAQVPQHKWKHAGCEGRQHGPVRKVILIDF